MAILLLALGLLGSELEHPSSVLLFWPAWLETGALALALTPIILTGGIDLSIGSTMALASVTLGQLWRHHDWPIGLAAVAAVLVGALAGAGNAVLVVAGVSSIIATLATLAFYAGLAMALSRGERIGGLPSEFTALSQDSVVISGGIGLPNQVWLLAAVFVVAYMFIHHTRFGRYLYAMGVNRTAARFAVLPVRRLEASIYIVCGAVAGLVAVFYTARSGAAIPHAGQGRELEAIACVVLGGTSVTGGYGGVVRTLIGVLVVAHLDIALQLVGSLAIQLPGMQSVWQPTAETRLVILGLMLVAVAIWNQRISADSGRAR
ncbi:MAG: ABC transporter permease [Pirellulales bacterium]|nr:ABC transporter permease [Pirellulales bacterium]